MVLKLHTLTMATLFLAMVFIPYLLSAVCDDDDDGSDDTECSVRVDPASYLNYPIHDMEADSVRTLINDAKASLDTNHYFLIPNFLTRSAVELFRDELTSDNTKKAYSTNVMMTVFQDTGDYDTFPDSTHSRNHLLWSSQLFIGRGALMNISSRIIDLYSYPPLLTFLKSILTDYSDLFRSRDPAGSVYSIQFKEDWTSSWHIDEHPFSCVWSIQVCIG